MDPSDYMKDPRPPHPDQLSTSLPGITTYVTTHDSDSGKSVVHSSREGKWAHLDDKKMAFNVLYTNDFTPDLNEEADISKHDELTAAGTLGLVRPKGSVIRVVDFQPGYECIMHRTQSLDYGIVIEGTVEMVLDDGSVTLLRRGDVAVQRATMHAWRNPSETEWTRMIFILQDSQPLTVKGEKLGEDLSAGGEGIPPSGND